MGLEHHPKIKSWFSTKRASQVPLEQTVLAGLPPQTHVSHLGKQMPMGCLVSLPDAPGPGTQPQTMAWQSSSAPLQDSRQEPGADCIPPHPCAQK